MYRKNDKLNFNYIKDMLEIKDVREMITKEYILYEEELSKKIIEKFKLKRIKLRYIDKTREYKDSYYSRNSLKIEEKVFITKMLLIREYINSYNSFLSKKKRVEKKVLTDSEFEVLEDLKFIEEYYKNKKNTHKG